MKSSRERLGLPTTLPSLASPPGSLDHEIESINGKLRAIQQVFDFCGRPLQELRIGVKHGVCGRLTELFTQATRVSLRRLYIEFGPGAQLGGEDDVSDHHNMTSLEYLSLKEVSD